MEVNVTDYKDVAKLLQGEIRDAQRGKTSFKHIAQKTGLSPQTISKLHYGETRFPRYLTIVLLLNYFGYGLYARRTNVNANPNVVTFKGEKRRHA